jgi:hypothetical protein
MPKKNQAGVIVKAEWIERIGLSQFFKRTICHKYRVRRDCRYRLQPGGHPFFAEIEFSPQSLNGGRTKVLIPKGEVAAIMLPQKAEDLSRLGFRA